MKTKNVIIVLAVLLVVSFIYFFFRSVKVSEQLDSEEVSIPAVEDKELENKPAIEMSTGQVFTDNEFGFQMTFTDAWKGYGFSKQKPEGSNYTNFRFFAPVGVSASYPEGLAVLLSVSAIPKADYYAYSKELREQGWLDEAPGVYVTEDENNVFTWNNPQDLDIPAVVNFDKLWQDKEVILKTFKFNK